MKKIYFIFMTAVIFALVFCLPVSAAQTYGAIYDETDSLGSETLTVQGEQTLPKLSEKLGMDLRVDILTKINDDGIGETAAWIYKEYDYGYSDKKEGVTLTLLLEQQDANHYKMPSSNGWYVYTNLSAERGDSQGLSDAVRNAVAPYMMEQSWNGEDMTMSATVLTQAVDAMAKTVEDYSIANNLLNSSSENASTEVAEISEQGSVTMQYVFDESDLLSYKEWEELESRSKTLSQRHHCGIYFALVDDYTEYGDGDVFNVTQQIYKNQQLGMGDTRDGIIVLLSMDERDYAMFVYGENAEYAFNAYGRKKLESIILEDFGNNDWYSGISHYLDTCDQYLTQAEEGKPVHSPYWITILAVIGISCLIAGGICFLLIRKMKTVHQKVEANEYIVEGGLYLTNQYDRYTHTTETRTKIKKENTSENGGSGRSGKF